MKKFLFLMLGILMFSCNKEDVLNEPYQNTNKGNISKVFSGIKRSPQTKGIAQERNLWRAGMTLRIKFLDGTTEEHNKVKEYAKEWMKYANIKFDYITTGNADVRITFEDEAKEISWSYIGSDAKAVPDQSKPTANLAYFGFFDDEEEDRAGVLRLFGQILGLELEHRHLDFDPKWNPKKDIEDYWTENITDTPWELLKEYVLEPLIDDQIIQTEEFDDESIMKWGFPKGWSTAANLLEKNMNSELSDMDKEFIALLYPFDKSRNATVLSISVTAEDGNVNMDFNEILSVGEDAAVIDENIEIDFGTGESYKGTTLNAPTKHYPIGNYKITIYADKISLNVRGDKLKNIIGDIEQYKKNLYFKKIKFNGVTEYTFVDFQNTGLLNVEIDEDKAPNFLQKIYSKSFGNTPMENIPENLFANSINATTFLCTFILTSIKNIPENLFKYNTSITSFQGFFGQCNNISSIPENLFKYNTKATSFIGVFNGCKNITSIPENLFKYNINAVDFNSTFAGCEGLTSIPENLFKYNIKVRSIEQTFHSCKNLTKIPENLFKYNIEIYAFLNAFKDCENITSIPENLFKYNPKANFFTGTFSGCKKLTSIPENLFANKHLAYVRETFSWCINLTGLAPNIWESFYGRDSYRCFAGCTKLENYNEIPGMWK